MPRPKRSLKRKPAGSGTATRQVADKGSGAKQPGVKARAESARKSKSVLVARQPASANSRSREDVDGAIAADQARFRSYLTPDFSNALLEHVDRARKAAITDQD